jgi:hypothetical protein
MYHAMTRTCSAEIAHLDNDPCSFEHGERETSVILHPSAFKRHCASTGLETPQNIERSVCMVSWRLLARPIAWLGG